MMGVSSDPGDFEISGDWMLKAGPVSEALPPSTGVTWIVTLWRILFHC